MGVRAAVVVVVLVLGVVVTRVVAAPQDDITLSTGGYTGVVVAMSDQLDPNKCTEYVDNTKAMFEAASQLMFTATGSKVFFGEVVIAVPETWMCTGSTFNSSSSRIYSWDSAHLRVGPAHPVFGDNPWTQQPGGCGDPGDWIYMPEKFLLGNTSYGSQGSVLVHEWAKYRWGVFEEYGHISDPVYPPAYLNQSNEMVPTYCTDQPVEGALSCNGGTEAECQFIPELTGNSTATSSLLAAPFLDTVVNFCNNKSHNTAAPTKQNLLCDQSSAWDVINRHSDMQGAQSSLTSTNFSLVYEGAAGPRLVLLLDYSSVMGEMSGRWEQLRDNVVQYIMTEAAADSYMAVVVFSDQLSNSTMYPLSVYDNRAKITTYIPSSPPTNSSANDKDLHVALSRGSMLLDAEGGTMVLVTHNMKEYTTTQNLTVAAENNAVWPILYPCDSSVSTAVYEKLADISPDTSVLTVISGTYVFDNLEFQSLQNSADLHRSLITAVDSPATRVTSGSCTGNACTINLEMVDSTEYISTAYIKAFYGSLDHFLAPFTVVVTSPSGVEIPGAFNETCALFQISTLQAGVYVVSITGSFPSTSILAELWATPATPLGLQVSVWSSQGLRALQSLPGIPPTVFAKVSSSDSLPVLFAEITGQVTAKGTVTTEGNITLNDAGFGGDVTGNDGIYTGYLVGFEPNMDVSISLTVTDNNGAARVVNPSVRTAPTTPEKNTCCGSQLDVSLLQLDVLGNFTLSPAAVSGRVTGVSYGTLPPGRVRDLQASSTGWDVTLTFTATGGQLDQGTADEYERKFQAEGEEAHVANFTGLWSVGSRVELQDKLPGCNKMYTMTVEAISGEVRGGTSNSVRVIVSCDYKVPNNLSGGAIAGITIGCILGVLLIVLIIYLCLNRDHLDELWVWYILTCGCIREKEEDLYRQPTQARRTDVIRSNTNSSKPARNLSDLYALPKLTGKSKQNKAEDQDDGGFGERGRRQENTQRRAPEDVESVASSHSTLPINQVGLPVGGDNHGYDDEPYTIYKNVPAPVRYPRANTQV